jgi:hypothetical protein
MLVQRKLEIDNRLPKRAIGWIGDSPSSNSKAAPNIVSGKS